MLNFNNLNDNEFEELCCDVMSKKLNIPLRRYAAGKDQGIDLTDSIENPRIVVQVKHYKRTGAKGMIQQLKGEIEKVKKINPKQYYVCCYPELGVGQTRDVYEMFKEYMESENNIIDAIVLSDFLADKNNIDILRKNYKLWMESLNIWESLEGSELLVDAEDLEYRIKKHKALYVQTKVYDDALQKLKKERVLILIGNPGVGKTITSEMIVLEYMTRNYKITYTTSGIDNIGLLKREISKRSNIDELILLDDCFGQAYFDIGANQGKELVSLINYVRRRPNKVLLLNSRITIYNEATKRTSDLADFLCDDIRNRVVVIDVSNTSDMEKARILYNHLYMSNIGIDYYNEIKKDKRYRKIISHPNYNPRIIEYVTKTYHYKDIPVNRYYKFLLSKLENPEEVWREEFENRLEPVDRILLLTLYSLTTTSVRLDILKKSFEKRISVEIGIDTTVNVFDSSLKRLSNGFVNIIKKNKKWDKEPYIGISNPSINDFLRNYLKNNEVEHKKIIDNAICWSVYERLLTKVELEIQIRRIFERKDVDQFVFLDSAQKIAWISHYIGKYGIVNLDYRKYLFEYVSKIYQLYDWNGECSWFISKRIMEDLLMNPIFSEYHLEKELIELCKKTNWLSKVEPDTTVKVVCELFNYLCWDLDINEEEEIAEALAERVKESIEWYYDGYSVSDLEDCFSEEDADDYIFTRIQALIDDLSPEIKIYADDWILEELDFQLDYSSLDEKEESYEEYEDSSFADRGDSIDCIFLGDHFM